jgi:hypothetical protein
MCSGNEKRDCQFLGSPSTLQHVILVGYQSLSVAVITTPSVRSNAPVVAASTT